MITTAFFTLCCKKLRRYVASVSTVALYLTVGGALWLSIPAYAAEVTTLRVERADDGMYLSATVNFVLPPALEEALLKGIPLTFVSEADVYRDRWYWYDKRMATASRNVRLAYQPLTRRWRVGVTSGAIASPAATIALTQHYDNLNDALAVVRRISRWKISELSEIDIDTRHSVEYRFKLDLSQLPRPLQIGVAGQNDWSITAERSMRPELRTEPR